MLIVPWLRAILVTLALWCVTLITWFFCLPSQPAKNLASGAEYTAVLSNIGNEDLIHKVHALAQEQRYSYILTTNSDLSLGTIYDPDGHYELDSQVRDSLERGSLLVRQGLDISGQLPGGLGVETGSYSLTPVEAEAYPQVILPPSLEQNPIYYQFLISADQPLDGQKLAQSLSPSMVYKGTLQEAQAPRVGWLLTGIYTGGAALLLLVYLVVTYRNIQAQSPYLKAMALLGGSWWDHLKRTLAVSVLPSLLALAACAPASYLYQFTPFSGPLRENPTYLQALVLNLLSLPWACLAISLGLSYFCVRQVKNENLS